MVDYAPAWNSIPRDHRDTRQASHDMPLPQVRKSAASLATLLDENKDEQVLREACLGLCQLFGEGIQNDRIQAILEANVVPKLVSLLRPGKKRLVPIAVKSAALQVLGNVACGDDRQTQVVIDSDALPCLRDLLESDDRGIRKEVCWIVSNITESSHQVQDVLDADILPPLLTLLGNDDAACREDATWVLFNLSSNRDPNQIAYLAENNGVRALCNLLTCSKDLDVLWKGCVTVAAVALKGLRNILISGHLTAASDGCNKMALLVAEAHGVERIELLTSHESPDVRNRARLILERIFGAEATAPDHSPSSLTVVATTSTSSSMIRGHEGCHCSLQQHNQQIPAHISQYQPNGLYDISENLTSHASLSPSSHFSHSIDVEHPLPIRVNPNGDIIDVPGSTSGSSTDSDPEDDDSDSELIPPPPAPCACLFCSDVSPLAERRSRGRVFYGDVGGFRGDANSVEVRPVCEFCSISSLSRKTADSRGALASRLGRAVRLGHSHCLAVLLSRMTWSQRTLATEVAALLHPTGGSRDVASGLPAVFLAAQLGKPDCLALLLKKCRPNLDVTYGKKKMTALAWAAHKSFLRCCQLLLDFGSNPATLCGDSMTALHLTAAGGGHISVCKLLLDHGAPVNAQSTKKQTPLCLAAQNGFSKVIQLLLDHGADANTSDLEKFTPLHLAAAAGFEHCVDLLLKSGAVVDTTSASGVTPLHGAVRGGHSAVVRLLVSAGASASCKDNPLLLIATDEGKADVVEALLDGGAAVNCTGEIKATLTKNMQFTDQLTALHLASSKCHNEVIQLLLKRGASVNVVASKTGWSALDLAVLNGHATCAMTLLENGATVTDTCKKIRPGWTLVQYAAHHGSKDVIRLLVQRLKEQSLRGTELAAQSALSAGTSFAGTAKMGNRVFSEIELNNVSKADADAVESVTHGQTREGESGTIEMDTVFSKLHAAHRYDPRSTAGDETGFSSGSGYANGSKSRDATSKSRRRVVNEDRQAALRARDMRKRESEANEARDRLEEAIIQRSAPKLTEAISHVSKLVLHLATGVGSDVTCGSSQSDHVNSGFNDDCSSGSQTVSPGTARTKDSSSTAHPNGSALPLAMEIGLGNEVQKAQKILDELLTEEKRIREEKKREAADSKRENAQLTVKKVMASTLDGGDPRSLFRAVSRATRTVLETSDSVIVEANSLISLISDLEKCFGAMRTAMRERNLEDLSICLPKVKEYLFSLQTVAGESASLRIFGGVNPSVVLSKAEDILHELQDDLARAREEEAHAKDQERIAKAKLQEAIASTDIVSLEAALKEASSALLSKESELASVIESAKKTLTKWVKGERRRMRQARSTNDPDVIEKAAAAAQSLGLKALQSDVESANAHALKLRQQADAMGKLQVAMDNGDILALNEMRVTLNKLGMFSDAECARAEGERLQRARRARTLLEGAIEDGKACRNPIANAFSERRSVSEMFELLSSWKWPDAQRLVDLSNRAKLHGQSSQSLCETADLLASELAVLGRRILGLSKESNDARAIAAMIAGYEKSFVSVSRPDLFGAAASDEVVSDAKKRLAIVQAMDQESVKAESAQVKVEYAMATARRSISRHRQSKSGPIHRAQAAGPSSVQPSGVRYDDQNGVSASAERPLSSKSSECGDEEVSDAKDGLKDVPVTSSSSLKDISAGYRAVVAKKSRGPSHINGDSTFLDSGIEGSGLLTGECSHFYLYKEGSTVLCIRCGHLRSSGNPEWLARVKRRGSKSSDLFGFALPHEGHVADQIHSTVGMRDINASYEHSGDARYGPLAGSSGEAMSARGVYGSAGVSLGTGVNGEAVVAISGRLDNVGNASSLDILSASSHVHCHGGEAIAQLPRGSTTYNVLAPGTGVNGQVATVGHSLYGVNIPAGHPPIVVSNGVGCAGPNPSNVCLDSSTMASPAALPSVHQHAVHGYGFDALGGIGSGKNRSMQIGNSRGMGVEHMIPTAVRSLSGVVADDVPCGTTDLGMEFANENFGFDIDAIVDDSQSPSDEGQYNMDSEDYKEDSCLRDFRKECVASTRGPDDNGFAGNGQSSSQRRSYRH